MPGVSSTTGRFISHREHLEQSIRDVILTPLGSRVHRRTYGSEVPFLVDRPKSASTILRLQAAAISAVRKWEPRVEVERATVELAGTDPQGPGLLRLTCRDASSGAVFTAGVALPG